jgi:predicted ATPase/DNA-binding CsgD family transcriptional regulator
MGTVAGRGHQAAAAPSNIPGHLTSFVGRDAELRALKTLLGESRLVTIIGTGGAGKTRLAAELTRSATGRWPDGIWWIDLAGADEVLGSVIASAELPGRGRPIDVVTSWLAPRRALLVLDNCEHLIAKSAEFCQAALGRCPELTILATSREALGVPGEARWPLSSLAETEALKLFEARARLVLPDFNAMPQVETIARICDRLDRLPLAIEMASARLDMMSERELLQNLDDRFRVLDSGARTAPERQQTMAATIDWSHRLLTAEEARMFARLGAFQGGFTLDAAEAVCSEPGGGVGLVVLGALVKKSMVVADRLDDGSTRYRLLETHHAYAMEKLHESGEHDEIRRRHYEYFRRQGFSSRESANFWAAVAWAHDHDQDGSLELAIEIADSEFSDQARVRGLLLELLDRHPAHDTVRVRALNLAARLASRQADHASAKKLADSSIALARELADLDLIAHVLSGGGVVYHAADDLAGARRMYDEALSLLKGSGNRRLATEMQNHAAVLATEQGQHAEAREMLKECLVYSRAQGDTATTAKYLESLASAELGLGDVDSAERSWREALSTFGDLADPFGTIWAIGGLALTAAARRDDARALRLAAIVDRMSREWSLSAWSVRVAQLDEACTQVRARLGARKADSAWNEGLSMSSARALEYALDRDMVHTSTTAAGPLSRREQEVVAMVAAGLTNKQIAQRLFIAERTAEGHVERIRNKLGVRSRTEVATWAVAHGIVPANLDKPSSRSTV